MREGFDINNKTNVPLFAVIAAAPFIVGAILWLANVDAKASSSLTKAETQEKILWRLQRSMIRIEAKLGTAPPRDDDN